MGCCGDLQDAILTLLIELPTPSGPLFRIDRQERHFWEFGKKQKEVHSEFCISTIRKSNHRPFAPDVPRSHYFDFLNENFVFAEVLVNIAPAYFLLCAARKIPIPLAWLVLDALCF